MKTLLQALCAFTLCAAGWLAVMETILHHPGFFGRIGLAVLLVSQSAATLLVLGRRGLHKLRIPVILGAVGIVGLGAAVLGRVADDTHFEGFAVIIASALILQGVITVLSLNPVRPSPTRAGDSRLLHRL